MPLSSKEIKEILAILEESGWDEARVTIGDVTISVSKDGPVAAPPPSADSPAVPGPPAASSAGGAVGGTTPEEALATGAGGGSPAATGPAQEAARPERHVVAAPSVGVFWRAPEPGAAPFVEVGDEVEAGQTLCIVEVMKLMQHVAADIAGVVTAIHVENSENVEFGTPLFSIAPSSAA